jgi:hypothetical protein
MVVHHYLRKISSYEQVLLLVGSNMDLESFAEEQSGSPDGRRRRCLTCALPQALREQVEDGRSREGKPIPFETISKWLAGEGHKIQPNTMRNHFVAGHHND